MGLSGFNEDDCGVVAGDEVANDRVVNVRNRNLYAEHDPILLP
jgi:hypothetical protein